MIKLNANPLLDENPQKRPKITKARGQTTLVASSTPAWQKIPYHLLGSMSGTTSIRLYTTSSDSESKGEELVDETKEKAEPTESEEDVAADRSTVDPLRDESSPTTIPTEVAAENEVPAQAEEDASATVSSDIILADEEHMRKMMALKGSIASEAEKTEPVNSKRPSSKARKLTHLDQQGNAHMVSIHNKDVTSRTAVAVCYVYFSNAKTPLLISHNLNRKGDVLGVARVAGIMAAKKCSEIIPLCHPIMLSYVGLDLEVHHKPKRDWKSVGEGLDRKLLPVLQKEEQQKGKYGSFGSVAIKATVSCDGQTGVEMEALTAASTAALTVYDMCKGLDKGMKIGGLQVLRKEGGKSGTWVDGKKEVVLEEKSATLLDKLTEEAQTRASRRMEAAGWKRGPL